MAEITELLKAWNSGDTGAGDRLMRLVTPELKKIAHRYMRREKAGHILETNALVNEAMIRLIREELTLENRRHFYAVITRRMRQVLMRYANTLTADEQVSLSVVDRELQKRARRVINIEEAIRELAKSYRREATVFRYRFFSGLSLQEIADTLDISVATVQRDLRFARHWLTNHFEGK